MLYNELDYKGYHIKIELDALPEDPRKVYDHFGIMVCFHREYSLGDEHNFSFNEGLEIENNKHVVSLPIYLYDHSGITMNTIGFSCPWDSGKVGFIYVEKEKIKNEFGWKYFTKKRIQEIEQILKKEVEEYDQYIRGDVYGYIVSKNNEETDSLWGMYGYDYVLEEAKRQIDYLIENSEVQLELNFA